MTMYSQYLNDRDFVQMESESARPAPEPPRGDSLPGSTAPKQPHGDLLQDVTGGISKLLGNVFRQFSPGQFDTGDILLVLIILFLFLEGDNLEVVITLGLMLLLGLDG